MASILHTRQAPPTSTGEGVPGLNPGARHPRMRIALEAPSEGLLCPSGGVKVPSSSYLLGPWPVSVLPLSGLSRRHARAKLRIALALSLPHAHRCSTTGRRPGASLGKAGGSYRVCRFTTTYPPNSAPHCAATPCQSGSAQRWTE